MSRIIKAYEARFKALLQELAAHQPERGVQSLLAQARAISQQERISATNALDKVYERVRRFVVRHNALKSCMPKASSSANNGRPPQDNQPVARAKRKTLPAWPPHPMPAAEVASGSIRFWCDAGLGGLARWLRAAGYEAFWRPDIDDAELLVEAHQTAATILTTDSLLMDRRALRDGSIPAFWLPPTLTVLEQLAKVFSEFRLKPNPARCMRCGGELHRVKKESVLPRIPPKTRLWKDEYYTCVECDQLFWHGTHWENIQNRLEALRRNLSKPQTTR